MGDYTAAFLDAALWGIIAWVVGSAIHIFIPSLLVYYTPPALLFVVAMAVFSYTTEEGEDDDLMKHPNDLE